MVAAANLPWGGTGIGAEFTGIQGNYSLRNGRVTGFRFRARHSGSLLSVAVHIKGINYIEQGKTGGTPTSSSDGGNNYGWGSGGNVRVRVFTANGDLPNYSNEVGRSENYGSMRSVEVDNHVRVFQLYKPQAGSNTNVDKTQRMTLTSGTRYHILFENNNSDSILNWISVNWGHCVSSPRTGGAWSPYWNDERVMTGTKDFSSNTFSVSENRIYQPAFQLRIDPSNGDPDVYWGPINLISNNLLEKQQDSDSSNDSGTGGVYKIDGTYKLRQKFRVPRAMNITQVRLAPLWYGPTTGTSIMAVELFEEGNSNELATAYYNTDSGLYLGGTSYSNPWTSDKGDLVQLTRDFNTDVDLVTGKTYYLQFRRYSGSHTFLIPVAVDERESPNSPELTVYCPEGWSSSATYTYCQAEWQSGSGSWVRCSPLGSSQYSHSEVRARLIGTI